MGSTRLLTIGTALVATLAGSVPAAAAPPPPPPKTALQTGMQFAAGPDETTPGGQVVLSGWAGIEGRDTGNAGRVEFRFRKTPADKAVVIGSTEAGSSGKFRYTTKATVSGEYTAHYKHRKLDITADGTDSLNVYVDRPVDRFLYSWTAENLSCLPTCSTAGPEQFVGTGPIKVKLTRECLRPQSGGRIGFTNDAANTYKAGAAGWRDFPNGEGPTEFELKPGITRGHFYLEWTSGAPASDMELTACNLAFSATQQHIERKYV
ncbi:hypothetical protein [Actinoplanes xinjiangensis]|uniref:Uncharacterized protein n=1 Tax=Actinoplanes xinjiangensis TaxID=512350 RepID=A0A316FV48_9ACTN|nr:hypothetical protein [Actinoplanes xinjiangensis]PWK52479.1 hypothetical protein BC793_101488 [Actinoplanes xinjiangensis]GIF36824.1 hypothetical protein Axi01nite_11350 [Actinoplanes xinjiangensis]